MCLVCVCISSPEQAYTHMCETIAFFFQSDAIYKLYAKLEHDWLTGWDNN